ncbi:MAG: hypothetical protein ABI727_03330 [Nitrosospira sp.]
MTLPEIRTLIPHSGEMILLDRLIWADTENLCAEVIIRTESLFFDGCGVGAWVGIEYMAQAIAAYAGYSAQQRGDPIKIGFLLGTRRYEPILPIFVLGSVLQIHVHCALQDSNGLGAFECHIDDMSRTSDKPMVSATVTVFQPENVNDFL